MKRLPFLPIAWTFAVFAAIVFAHDNLIAAVPKTASSKAPFVRACRPLSISNEIPR